MFKIIFVVKSNIQLYHNKTRASQPKPNGGLMLDQRRRRFSNIKPALGRCLVLGGLQLPHFQLCCEKALIIRLEHLEWTTWAMNSIVYPLWPSLFDPCLYFLHWPLFLWPSLFDPCLYFLHWPLFLWPSLFDPCFYILHHSQHLFFLPR